MQEEQKIILPASVFNQLLDFLVKLPFAQVSPLIELLQQSAKLIQAADETQAPQQMDSDDEAQ